MGSCYHKLNDLRFKWKKSADALLLRKSFDASGSIARQELRAEWPCGGGLVAKCCPTLKTPWTVAHQAPLSMGFSR